MSGDVQPRKRKDKKKKKDDLGIEEPRGTAAALGEGDILMHSHHDHGTGGHWCAKVIFFSLLAVLVTLIGLIILENRGLSELEANSVESRYSGVLEGWLEDGHDDDHHDEHTLELHHHDDEEDDEDHGGSLDHDDDDDDGNDEDDEEISHEAEHDDNEDDEQTQEDDEDDEQNQEDEDDEQNEDDDEESQNNNDDDDEQDDVDSQEVDDDDNQSEEQNLETAEDEDDVEEKNFRRYYRSAENQARNDDDDDDDDEDDIADDKDNDQSVENDDDEEQNDNNEGDNEQDDDNIDSRENDEDEIDNPRDDDEDEDEEDHVDHNDHEEDPEVELEHIEEEVVDEAVSSETPTRKRAASEEVSKEAVPVADADDDEVELLESDELDDLPEELPIPMPKGKPLVEVEDTTSTEKPQDTLADEEEYERQQEALRKEKEEASQGMGLKLVVGGALLVATQAVLRRATAPRENEEGDATREETPLSDRRMTLIAESVPPPATPKPQEVSRPVVQKEIIRQAPVVQSAPPPPEDEEEEIDEDEEEEIVVAKDDENAEKDKELYSDEEDEEEAVEEKVEPPKPTTPIREPPKPASVKDNIHAPVKEPEKKEPPKIVEKEPTPEEDEDDDDVEIIEEEDIGEEEEEEISDVDDAELLTRLEAKYGRLPEPERPRRNKDGGDSIEDEWPGEPSDAYWRNELDQAEQDLRQGAWTGAAERASAPGLRSSARARHIVARAFDAAAEAKRDNGLLSKAIAAYLDLLKMNEKLSDKKLIQIADRALDRMKFRGNYVSTEPIYRLLIRRFPGDSTLRNNLTISFLMANRVDLAEEVIKETLKLWPNDRLALAHYGFILKTLHNKLEEAVDAFSKALEGDNGPANEPRYYYHLGDSLLLLGRFKEAHEVHKRGAKLGHFLSPAQRSLYNAERLKSQPWWDVEKTPYARLARALEKSWKEILKEGRAAQAMYEKEKEGLKEKGEWSQLDLFARGQEVAGRCARAAVTCGIVRSEVAASGCRRGQIKFSLMEAGTHVRPHVGPTNCRLRMHLGLSNTKDTYIRVDQETRQWQTGKVLMFDDSFEHEVWHNGTGARLVLIVDVWHPDLTRAERKQLPAI